MVRLFKISIAIIVIAFVGILCVLPNTPLVEAGDPHGPVTMTTQTGNIGLFGGFCIGTFAFALLLGGINLLFYKNGRGGGWM